MLRFFCVVNGAFRARPRVWRPVAGTRRSAGHLSGVRRRVVGIVIALLAAACGGIPSTAAFSLIQVPAMRVLRPVPLGSAMTPAIATQPALQPGAAAGQQESAAPAGLGAADSPEAVDDRNSLLAGMDEQARPSVEARLEQLWQIPLNRAPSALLDRWGLEQLQKLGFDDPLEKAVDLPPAPPLEDLMDDARFADFVAGLQRRVTLGDWAGVGEMTGFLDLSLRRRLFRRILQALAEPPGIGPEVQALIAARGLEIEPSGLEKHYLTPVELLELMRLSPDRPLRNEDLTAVGLLARQMLESGSSLESLLSVIRGEIQVGPAFRTVDGGGAARLLYHANQLDATGEFLPDFSAAAAARDFSTMNFLCEQQLAVYAKEGRAAILDRVWEQNLQIVAGEEVPEKELQAALARAVSLSPKIRAEQGHRWLADSFVASPERGVRILRAIGNSVSQAMLVEGHNPASRLELLKLQRDAVKALLESGPAADGNWQQPLELLALGWLREAEFTFRFDTSKSYGPSMRRDSFGNIYYADDDSGTDPDRMPGGRRTRAAVTTGEMLEVRPDEEWLAFVSPALRPRFDLVFARLFLKVSEDEQALPFIERVATTHPQLGASLADEFLQIWTQNHDPNAARNRGNSYIYMYGFEQRAESIPLTRSKQQRNLERLAGLIPRLNAVSGGKHSQELVASAFLACHSHAEVYRIADIERVFGQFEQIRPEVIGTLTQRMRGNLATVWREVETQKAAKTRRNQSELIAEVLRGYDVAGTVAERGLELHPGNWSLLLSRATLLHDRLNYESGLARTTEYARKQAEAMEAFQAAANAYAAAVVGMEKKEYSTEVFERWYYAALGACELGLVDAPHRTDQHQIPRIRAAILQLPPECREWHLSRFANLMFSRLGSCKPAVKQRYLAAGFGIVGDHPQAREARAVFDYYSDLVTEIRLSAVIDGAVQVGREPFGVFINLEHTAEIEREAGGFAKYLQNQNSGNGFFYNYGRPLEDYRDRFEEHVRETLRDRFDVLSVTFQVPEVQSREGAKEGWRVTPYAYLLLKAQGEQVDSLPPLRLDLDFLDTSGYAVLPVESAPTLLDATRTAAEPRPWSDLQVTQILDERQAAAGKLILEIRATARGLVPGFAQVFGSPGFGSFALQGGIPDDGVTVDKFDESADTNVVNSQRSWVLTLVATGNGGVAKDREFRFPEPLLETGAVVWQRYQDADLKPASQVVALQDRYSAPVLSGWWKLVLGSVGGLAILLMGLIGWRWIRTRPPKETWQLPDNLSPFALIGMLQELRASGGLSAARGDELSNTISRLERWYFSGSNGSSDLQAEPELERIAQNWLDRRALAGLVRPAGRSAVGTGGKGAGVGGQVGNGSVPGPR